MSENSELVTTGNQAQEMVRQLPVAARSVVLHVHRYDRPPLQQLRERHLADLAAHLHPMGLVAPGAEDRPADG